ncbi:MAG: hypothetical protein ABI873_13315, partial [Marmoricola sp.]
MDGETYELWVAGFRTALAVHGYPLDPETAEVAVLAGYAGSFSARARQIKGNIDRYEAKWRTDHPGEEPRPAYAPFVGPAGVGGRTARQGR